jgi:hypothetical protein
MHSFLDDATLKALRRRFAGKAVATPSELRKSLVGASLTQGFKANPGLE